MRSEPKRFHYTYKERKRTHGRALSDDALKTRAFRPRGRGSRGSRRGARRREAKTQAGGVENRPSFTYPNVATRLEPKLDEPHVKRHAKPTPTVATLFDGGGGRQSESPPAPKKKKNARAFDFDVRIRRDFRPNIRSFMRWKKRPPLVPKCARLTRCKVGPSQTGGLEFDAAVAAFFPARPRAAPAWPRGGRAQPPPAKNGILSFLESTKRIKYVTYGSG